MSIRIIHYSTITYYPTILSDYYKTRQERYRGEQKIVATPRPLSAADPEEGWEASSSDKAFPSSGNQNYLRVALMYTPDLHVKVEGKKEIINKRTMNSGYKTVGEIDNFI